MKEAISKLVCGKDLREEETERVMKILMSGEAGESQAAAFLTALRIKGETPEEIAALAKVMKEYATKISPKVKGRLVDVCGTGGDASGTFNVSTAAAFAIAGAGVCVAKHGNRAMTSKCGSADVLEALGARLDNAPGKIESCIEEVGIGFMFAPNHHSATRHVVPVRKALGFRTVFNVLGPLTNPAGAKAQLMGVYDEALTEKIADVFRIMGTERAMVVHGAGGLDEISVLGETKVSELKEGGVNTYYIKPQDYGIQNAGIEDISGGTPEENAKTIKGILEGTVKGPKRDIVLLNAAAGIVVGGKADDLREGLSLAEDSIDSGRAHDKLLRFIEYTRE